MHNRVSREFLTEMEYIRVDFSKDLDNMAFIAEAAEDFIGFPQKEAYSGALWCVYEYLCSSYQAMTAQIEAEYARLRGEAHG